LRLTNYPVTEQSSDRSVWGLTFQSSRDFKLQPFQQSFGVACL